MVGFTIFTHSSTQVKGLEHVLKPSQKTIELNKGKCKIRYASRQLAARSIIEQTLLCRRPKALFYEMMGSN